MDSSMLFSAVNHSRALWAVHLTSMAFGSIVLGLVALGFWSLLRANWRAGVLLGTCAFLWAQLLFPFTAALAAAATAAKLHLLGVEVTEHLDVVTHVAMRTLMNQHLALIGIPLGLCVALIGFWRAQTSAALALANNRAQ
jgi:hypothetical protein